MRPDLQGSLRLAGVYTLFSSLWIFGSDYLLYALIRNETLLTELQTVKGLVFVLLSTGLIFFVSYRDRQAQSQLLAELTHSSQLLKQAQRNAALGSWEYRDGFHWSPEALSLLGRSADDAQGSLEQLLSWLHPADRAAAQRAMQALLQEQISLSVSARLLQPNQPQSTWLMLRGEFDSSGKILGTLQNISTQKRDESALRESEQRFRQLFEQTPRIAVQGYDRERRVIYWNQASTQLYGYAVHEVMGRRLEELIVPPQARSKVVSNITLWQLGGPPIAAAEIQLQQPGLGLFQSPDAAQQPRSAGALLRRYRPDRAEEDGQRIAGQRKSLPLPGGAPGRCDFHHQQRRPAEFPQPGLGTDQRLCAA
jgi:PAS domain-containing protein